MTLDRLPLRGGGGRARRSNVWVCRRRNYREEEAAQAGVGGDGSWEDGRGGEIGR